MKSFAGKVYAITAKIPSGKVATYGQIARLAGSRRAGRAVGALMRRNTNKNVPCHRVVSSDGTLRGYAFGGILIKRQRLLSEGVLFLGSRVNLSKSLWNSKT
ncbi:MGMT family protein [Candidatus Kaiserbacteria bacterium]|nr:MGMT family protein [Candidatus Kaiserbacteria bacterium]